jgi:molybdopterin molybdotransferase
MTTVEEAARIISQNLYKPKPEAVSIIDAVGRVLSESVLADRDLPPFDRVAMDGIAIAHGQWAYGQREFLIEDTQPAGEPQKKLRDEMNCLEVMTGAVLPEGTDTVIRYEDIVVQAGKALVKIDGVRIGQNIHRQGADGKKGDRLIQPGTLLSPAEVAVLASVGMGTVDVFSMPSTALVASGDELVEIETDPEPHQIRRTNTYAIHAAMKQMQWAGVQYHLPDRRDFLQASLETILANHEVLIVSGGVSKGKFDFIPEVLEEIGIRKLFHQVSQRPGKPFWFGVSPKGKIVFALPGNPVSTFMCFYKYIKPWLQESFGMPQLVVHAALAADYTFEPDLTCFLQVQVINENGKLIAYARVGGGSGDFSNLQEVDGFLELPKGKMHYKAGEVFRFIPFR